MIKRFKALPGIFRKTRLKNKIFISYICIIVIIMAAVGTFNYIGVKKVLVEEESQIIEQALLQVAENISNKLSAVEEVSYFISRNNKIIDELITTDFNSIETVVRYYVDQITPFLTSYYYGGINSPEYFLYVNNGTLLPDGKIKDMNEIIITPWYRELLKEKKPVYWRGVFTAWNNERYIASYRKVIPPQSKDPQVIIEARIPVALISNYFRSLDTSKLGQVYLFDTDGNVILTNGEEDERILQVSADIGDYRGYGSTSISIDGKEKIIVYTALKLNNWKLISVLPAEKIYAKVRFVGYTTLVSFGLSIVLAGLIIYFISGILVGRLSRLLVKIRKLSFTEKKITHQAGEDEITLLNMGFDAILERIDRFIQTEYTLERTKRNLQLNLLLKQINPHFLYNTLSCIKWEAAHMGNTVIGDITDTLIRFYRLNLNSGKEYTRVRDELLMLQKYLKIFKFTYETEFDITYTVEKGLEENYVLNFILQPIIENALLHGIYNLKENGKIEVLVIRQGNDMMIEVCDNGRGISEEKLKEIMNSKKMGYGLNNIRERIELMHGKKYGIEIHSQEVGGTRVKLFLPLLTAEQVDKLIS